MLRVTVHSASQIAAADLTGTSDALVCIQVVDHGSRPPKDFQQCKDERRTSVQKRTRNPRWEETFELPMPAFDKQLLLSLWDEDSGNMREMFSYKVWGGDEGQDEVWG